MKGSLHISVYFADQVEIDMLKAQAALKGLSLSNYMRKKAGLDVMQVGQGMRGINRHKRSIGATLEQPEQVTVETVEETESEEKPVTSNLQPLETTPSHLEFSIEEPETVSEVSTAVM